MPQRFLRPGITTSDAWNAVSFEAQSFYVRILTLVDDFGRYDGRVAILHGQCFALRPDVTVKRTAALRCELHDAILIQVYESDGKEFIQVERWNERARSEKSKFPDVPPRQESAGIRSGKTLPSSSPSPLHPRSNAIASTQLRWSEAAGWSGKTSELVLELKAAYPACDIDRQFLEMAQWLKANPAKAKKTAWRRFVDNWLRRKQDRGGDVSSNGNGAHAPRQRTLSFDERAKRKGAIQSELNDGSKAADKDRNGRSIYSAAEQTRRDALYNEMEEL